MKKIHSCFLLILAAILFCAISCKNEEPVVVDYTQYVNPFIGTADNGHTFPGATVPFGFIQASPETGNDSWKYCSGFNFADDSIMGFAQTHINGTGCSDLGDILLFPYSGDNHNGVYKSRYDRDSQIANPGYYSVQLTDAGVNVELSATQRTAFHKYTFNKEGDAHILLDMQSGIVWDSEALKKHVLHADMEMPDAYTIVGHQEVKNWVQRHYFYVIKFDKPYTVKEVLTPQEGEKAKRMILSFDRNLGDTVQVKIALSTVSIDGALAAMNKENAAWDFEAIRDKAHKQWNEQLAKVDIVGSEDQKINFYTSLYHLFQQPANITDVDGQFRGADDKVNTVASGNYYSTLSLWDTYRAAHPLYTILSPEIINDMVNTMLIHHKANGFLPIWALWGKDNYCMIGNHSIPVIVDAYLKGFKGFDVEKAYEAIKTTSTVNHINSDWDVYMKYGYYPFDIIDRESVSRTLESVYDDYCVAQMAKALGKAEDYEYFSKRANFYKNVFDPETKLMRGKDSKGNWDVPFNPFLLSHAATTGGNYTEGNAWQYTWHVQHDVEGLIELIGGKEAFEQQLDSLFAINASPEQLGEVLDVTGLIGQYAHGNEPSHHVAYFYNYIGKPAKTQSVIREIFDRFYLPKVDGLCGNDDCGQMSAWYIFSAMGFYPVNPIGGEYIIGAPQIEKISLSLPNNKKFVVKANGLSDANKYVENVSLNGIPITDFRIHHKDIMQGGELVFTMTDKIK